MLASKDDEDGRECPFFLFVEVLGFDFRFDQATLVGNDFILLQDFDYFFEEFFHLIVGHSFVSMSDLHDIILSFQFIFCALGGVLYFN